jgi:thymidylate synthase ThyX
MRRKRKQAREQFEQSKHVNIVEGQETSMGDDVSGDFMRAQEQEAFGDVGAWSRKVGEHDDQPLLRDVAFNKHSRNFHAPDGANIVSPSAQGRNQVGVDGIEVRLVQGLPSEFDVAKVIWKGINATKGVDINDESRMLADISLDPESWREMFKGGLQTAMEAFVIVFEVSGVSRTCTHQIVRSRRAGFHQQSQRAGSYVQPSSVVDGKHTEGWDVNEWGHSVGDGEGANVRIPESLWRAMGMNGRAVIDGPDWDAGDSGRKHELAHAVGAALMWSRRAYRLACESDVSYQDARYILPEATTNYIMCEYTLREFLNVYAYRACSMFSWEITHVVREMGRLLLADSPWLRGTGGEPKISCERSAPILEGMGKDGLPLEHACTFQGWERVEEQCAFPWAKDDNRTFKPRRSI